MLFESDDIAVLLDALGTAVTIDDASVVTGVFAAEDRRIEADGASFWTTTPTVALATADAELVTVSGSVLTIEGVDYQPFDKQGPTSGTVTFFLTRDF